MNAPPRTRFLARTFGWSGTRHEWLALAAVLAWLTGGFAINHYGRRLTVGETLFAYAVWLLVLLVAARDAVRNLFGPVFFYDIVRVGRQRLTFVLRLAYAVGVGLTLLLMYFSWLDYKVDYFRTANPVVGTNELSQFGTEFFQTFVVIQFLVVVLLTPVYVAGTITVEKERKTLEFLLATDLRNREIVFGKLASRVTNLLMFVLVGLPILAFIQLFGGVDPEQLLVTFVATVTTVVGLSALGIWFSTMQKKSRDAIMLTYLTYGAYVFASLFAAAYSNFAPPGWWNTPVDFGLARVGINDVLWRVADGNVIWHIVVMGSQPRFGALLGDQLTRYVLFWGIASVLLLGHATLRLRAVALNQSYGGSGGTRSRKRRVVTADGAAKVIVNESTHQHPEVGANPVFWKEVFVDAGRRGGWMSRVIGGLIVVLLFIPLAMIVWDAFFGYRYYGYSGSPWHGFVRDVGGWVRVVTGILTFLILLAAAVRGAGAITNEKDRDSWISLLSTPLSADEILMGKWWGCVLGMRRAYFLLLLVWSIGLAVGAVNPFLLVVTAGLIALFVAAFSWIGLYFSMTARNTMVATVRTFFASLFCMGGYWVVVGLCCVIPLSLFRMREREFEPAAQVLLAMMPPFLVGWFPMRDFGREDMGPFYPDQYGIGWGGPILAIFIWVGITAGLAVLCRRKFRKVTNREPQQDETGWVLKPERRTPTKQRPEPEGKRNRYE